MYGHRTASLHPFLVVGFAAFLTLSISNRLKAGTVEPELPNPILFVTQVPIPADFTTIGSTFGNHLPSVNSVGRGGDLYIRYTDGTLRNLTREAGFGSADAFQGSESIAVRDPSVHWDATRAVFSMVVGAPSRQFEIVNPKWQLYEVTGLGPDDTAVVTKIANQPEDFNNVSPVYLPDGRIAFTSDRPRNGAAHLYPQLDEYESAPTNTGLWSLDPASGELILLDHSPSGDFTPIVDRFGRLLFTRWDHLQRDQQADADAAAEQDDPPRAPPNGTHNFADESAGAERLDSRDEVFPEPRPVRDDLLTGTNLVGLRFNHFFPWQLNPDGTELETLNHIGRHELHSFFTRSFNDDPSLVDFVDAVSGRLNGNDVLSVFQLEEDPLVAGRYVATDAPEFGSHASGMLLAIEGGAPDQHADAMTVTYLTHPATELSIPNGEIPPVEHSGHYRDPLALADGALISAHTYETRADANEGSVAAPLSRYDFRLRTLDVEPSHGFLEADLELTSGLSRRVEYFNPDILVIYDGPLWELSPAEVRVRVAPPIRSSEIPLPEAQVFAEENIDPVAFRDHLRQRGLALIVSRDVTTRDALDRQQPFNLKVAGSSTQTLGDGGQLYEVAYLQLFQGDQIRGIDLRAGRRVLAQIAHASAAANPPTLPGAPPGSVQVASDGSLAAFVSAQRALTWQLTDLEGEPVVRERYWLTFQPGEVRVCASCHGLSSVDQTGAAPPENPPEALRELLRFWKASQPIFEDGFESGGLSEWSLSMGSL